MTQTDIDNGRIVGRNAAGDPLPLATALDPEGDDLAGSAYAALGFAAVRGNFQATGGGTLNVVFEPNDEPFAVFEPNDEGFVANDAIALAADASVGLLLPAGASFSLNFEEFAERGEFAPRGWVIVSVQRTQGNQLLIPAVQARLQNAQAGTGGLPAAALAPPQGAAPIGADFYVVQAETSDPAISVTGFQGEYVLFVTLPRGIADDLIAAGLTDGVTLARYDETGAAWLPLPTTFDPTLGQLSAAAPEFGIFRALLYPVVDHAVAVGFTALTYTGPDGLSPADLAALLGQGLQAIFRFDAAAQQWLVHRPGVLPVLNTLDRIDRGDALFLRHSQSGLLRLPDVTPPGADRTLSLSADGNFVGYTGPGGDVATVLGGLPGLRVAYVFDAVQQRWLAYYPAGPGFVSEVTALPRLAATFLMLDAPAAWTYSEALPLAAIPAGAS